MPAMTIVVIARRAHTQMRPYTMPAAVTVDTTMITTNTTIVIV